VKAALIGTGHIARQHLGCLAELPSVELVAVCDRSPAAAEIAAERFGAPRWFTDHEAMLEQTRPDVVHVTAPPHVHFALAMDALSAGSHVVVEKPAAAMAAEVAALLDRARAAGRRLVECHNYLFNRPLLGLRRLFDDGELGEVVHVEVSMCLELGAGSPFADRNLAHPTLTFPGGAIADFLPHLASIAHAFVGPHRTAHAVWGKRDAASPLPSDEFRGLVDAERGTAALSFSAHGQPDVFSVRVTGTRGRATAGLFEPRLVVERLRDVPRPLVPTLNGLHEGRTATRAAIASLARKFQGGPGGYEGLWSLIELSYAALEAGVEPPVADEQILAVHRLIDDLTAGAPAAA
jgi:predicted dehydrogenase